MSLDIMDIIRKAYWSNAKTFLQHYKKEITSYEGVDFNKIIEYWIFNMFVMFLYIEFLGINIEYARHKVTFTQISYVYH